MVLVSWGLGGDELAGVRVDVVEVVVVVVVVVVGVVCRHLLDAGGDAPHRLHVRLRGRPALCPPPFAPSSPPGLPCPAPPVPWCPRRPCPCPWAPFKPPARVAGPASRPPRPGTLALPPPLALPPAPGLPARAPARPSRALVPSRPPAPSRAVRSVPPRCCALPGPLAGRPAAFAACGSVTPGGERSRVGGRTCRSCPEGKGLGGNGLGGLVWVWVGLAWARYFALSLPPAAAAAAAGEASAARAGFLPRLRGVLGAAAWPAEAVSRPAGVAAAAPRAPSSLSFAAVAAANEAPVAAVATPRTPSSFSSAAAAAAGEAPAARAGSVPRVCGALEVAARPAEVVSRPAGVAAAAPRAPSPPSFAAVAAADEAPVARAVATPRAPFLLSSAAAAALGDAPGSCAGAAPRVGGVPGAAVGAAAWLAAVSASCVSGRGGAAGLAAWAAGAVASAGPGSRAGGGGPTSTAASASSSRSARVSPVHSGEETGERERDRRWWRSSRWGDPSESATTVTLVGMRGGRRALPTTSWCISAVPWAVPCGALRGGGG